MLPAMHVVLDLMDECLLDLLQGHILAINGNAADTGLRQSPTIMRFRMRQIGDEFENNY